MWAAAAVVAVVAGAAGPAVGAAEPAAVLATTLTGARVPGGGDAAALGTATVEVTGGALCAELTLSATSLPAAAARLVGPDAAVPLPPPAEDGRAPSRAAPEAPLLGARLRGLAGDAVATVAANPRKGRLCTEVPGGGVLRRAT